MEGGGREPAGEIGAATGGPTTVLSGVVPSVDGPDTGDTGDTGDAVTRTRSQVLLRDTPNRLTEVLGRAGLGAYGVVHLIVAVLGAKIFFLGRGRTHLDQRGAVATVAAGGVLGVGLLIVGIVALTAFAVWQVRAAVVGFRWASPPERWRKRCGAVGKAVGVLSVVWVSLRFLLRHPGDRRGVRTLCEQLFLAPGGRLLVAAVGVAAVGMAAAMAFTGVRRTFMGDLVLDRLHHRLHAPTQWLGSAGNLTRATAFGTLGVVTLAAAVADQPDRIGGVDTALRTLARNTVGQGVLVLATLGFAAYGVYCLLDAWARHP